MVDIFRMATKAFIEREGKILVLREGDYDEGTNEGKWQIPGGRMEPGEKYEEALKREVKEETGLEVEVGDPVTMGEWRPEIKGEKWQIVAVFFHCVNPEGEVELSEEHSDYRWIDPEDFDLEFIGNVPEKIEKFAGYGTSDLPKLVRDKVPEKIEEDGKTPFTDSSVDIEEFLLDKIVEEAKELRASRSLGELADLLEVMEAFKSEKGIKDSEVENARKEKQEEKGGFSEGLVLRDVDE